MLVGQEGHALLVLASFANSFLMILNLLVREKVKMTNNLSFNPFTIVTSVKRY